VDLGHVLLLTLLDINFCVVIAAVQKRKRKFGVLMEQRSQRSHQTTITIRFQLLR
jgi:hypothetical protein